MTLLALQVFQEIIPVIHPYMGNLVSLSVEPLVANLASNNKETRDAAARVLDLCMELLGMWNLVNLVVIRNYIIIIFCPRYI